MGPATLMHAAHAHVKLLEASDRSKEDKKSYPEYCVTGCQDHRMLREALAPTRGSERGCLLVSMVVSRTISLIETVA